jgi:galactonate dehydratase
MRLFSKSRLIFVKISTNQDIVGWGEGVDAVGRNLLFSSTIGKNLVGRSPLTPNCIFEQMPKRAFFGGAQSGVMCSCVKCF